MTVFFGDGTSQDSAATSFTANLLCKGWVNFNGQGTVSIRSSSGVNSITDNGTGNYNINFPSMGDANYCTVGSHNIQSVNNRVWGTDNNNYGATSVRITTEDAAQGYGAGSSRVDQHRFCLAFFT